MTMTRTAIAVFAAAAVIAAALPGLGAYAASPAAQAIAAASRQNQYSIVTFYKKNDAASTKMLADAKKLQSKYAKQTDLVPVDVGSKANQDVISRYGADRSPIPLTIVIAPNGAVTAGYPTEIKKMDLSSAFVSHGMAEVMKAMQDGKLAAVCFQNSKTKHNSESLAAANGLNKQAKFRGVVEVIKVDPSDAGEAKLVKACKADDDAASAQLAIIAPPGKLVGKFSGATTSESVAASLMKSLGGGCAGGCAGGCK